MSVLVSFMMFGEILVKRVFWSFLENFYVFRVLRVFRIPKCCQNLDLTSGLENRNFQHGFWCLEGVLVKVVFLPDY